MTLRCASRKKNTSSAALGTNETPRMRRTGRDARSSTPHSSTPHPASAAQYFTLAPSAARSSPTSGSAAPYASSPPMVAWLRRCVDRMKRSCLPAAASEGNFWSESMAPCSSAMVRDAPSSTRSSRTVSTFSSLTACSETTTLSSTLLGRKTSPCVLPFTTSADGCSLSRRRHSSSVPGAKKRVVYPISPLDGTT